MIPSSSSCYLSCLWLVLLAPFVTATNPTKLTYGKYFDKSGENANVYYLYRPVGTTPTPAANSKLPVIIQVHGGGFTGGAASSTSTPAIEAAVSNGLAYISVSYRLVATKYWYRDGSDANSLVEELIHVDAEGRLTLDTTGKTMDAYRVRRGRQEFNTKCSYDAAQMIEHVVAHADELGLDPHRISFTGGSAGGGEINYLTWVYHQWNAQKYTPVGMVYTMAQLDYPVQNMLDRVWALWADDVGNSTKLSEILSFSDCGMIVGNPWCEDSAGAAAESSRRLVVGGVRSGPSDYNLCNATYQSFATGKFCSSPQRFEAATLGDVRGSLVWPRDDPEVGPGMEVLWYTSMNMPRGGTAALKPRFYLYVMNTLNTTAGMNVVHNSLYARQFAAVAERTRNINFTVLYTDYHGMTDGDRGQKRVPSATRRHGKELDVVYNYRSSHRWLEQPGVDKVARGSDEEALLFHCLALGVPSCNATSPPPGPSGPLTGACKAAVDKDCGAAHGPRACGQCVRSNARTLMSAGCPKGPGAAAEVIQYCESRAREF